MTASVLRSSLIFRPLYTYDCATLYACVFYCVCDRQVLRCLKKHYVDCLTVAAGYTARGVIMTYILRVFACMSFCGVGRSLCLLILFMARLLFTYVTHLYFLSTPSVYVHLRSLLVLGMGRLYSVKGLFVHVLCLRCLRRGHCRMFFKLYPPFARSTSLPWQHPAFCLFSCTLRQFKVFSDCWRCLVSTFLAR